MAYKLKRMFDYPPLENPSRGVIGIPRVLNMYENYPFWATFFRELGFRVVLSPKSNRKIYELGMESIPSESECYPAKLSHGHVQWLINEGIKTIFHPCVFYEHQETPGAQNHYNCPIVVSYPENLKNNVEAVADGEVRYIRPFLAFTSEKIAADRLAALCKEEWGIDGKEVRAAVHKAWEEQQRAKSDVRAEGQKALQWMADNHARGIVLAGRPYHIDPEINHGIPEMIASYDLAVLTEDSLPIDFTPERPLRVNDQWVYHSRLYSAAEFVRNREDLELIQLNSFGCGLDAVTTDQVCEILEGSNKLYTVLKIDEVNNLGAARIRIRSLLAAMNQRQARGIRPQPKPAAYHRSEFTKEMYQSGYTILAPQMSPIHFDLLEPIFKKYGYHIEGTCQRQPRRHRHGSEICEQRRLLSLHHRGGADHGRGAFREIRHGQAGRDDDPDRRLLPGKQLRGLHPPGAGQGGTGAYPGHLPEHQRHGDQRGLQALPRPSVHRAAGRGLRRPVHALPVPGTSLREREGFRQRSCTGNGWKSPLIRL